MEGKDLIPIIPLVILGGIIAYNTRRFFKQGDTERRFKERLDLARSCLEDISEGVAQRCGLTLLHGPLHRRFLFCGKYTLYTPSEHKYILNSVGESNTEVSLVEEPNLLEPRLRESFLTWILTSINTPTFQEKANSFFSGIQSIDYEGNVCACLRYFNIPEKT